MFRESLRTLGKLIVGSVVGGFLWRRWRRLDRNVAERQPTRKAFSESEASLVRYTSDIVTILGTDGTLSYGNPAVERVLGYRPEERMGTNALEYVHPDDVERVSKALVEGLGSPGVHPPVELRFRHSDGSWRRLEVIANNLLEDPSVRGIVLTSRDITERKQTERRLEESEQRHRSLFKHNPDAVYSFDLEGNFLAANRACERISGYTVEELLRISFRSLIVEEDLKRTLRHFEKALQGEPQNYENAIMHKDGRRVELNVTKLPIVVGGEVVGVYGIAKDVTKRKRAEEALRESEERFRALVQNSSDMITVVGTDGTILYHSPSINRVLGHEPGSRVGKNVFESALIHPEDLPRHSDAVRKTLSEPGSSRTVEMRMLHRDGTYRHIEATMRHAVDQSSIRGTVANSRDVTERKRAEEALRESQARLAEAQRIARVGSWEYAVGEDEALWSDEMYRIFGHDPGSFVPTYRTFLRSVHPDDRGLLLRKVRKALREGKHYGHDAEFRVVRPDGGVRAIHVRYEVLGEDEAGRPTKMAGTLQDVTERKALEERLEYQAFHDPLTGLANRALFADRLAHALSRAERRGGNVAVLFLDLDNFKYVNDSLGHNAGDQLLVAVAGRLEGSVRPEDTVARLGGDEFAVLLEEVEGAGGAIRVAERVTEALRGPFDLGGRELFAGASIGVALCEAGRGRLEDLLRKADLALYQAKREGKARYALFDPEAERRSIQRLELENGLRRAVERDELVVHYQPVVSLATGRVKGFEALVRWEHPERGLVSPDEFVPLAEENGLIVPIGRRVLGEACRRAEGWQGFRPHGPPPIVGVNLSARQLSHPDLISDVAGALAEAGLDPDLLTLEVTESVLVEDAERHADALGGLRELGVRFAIDDFGTGYSSLSYLKRLAAGVLKLDGWFVRGIGEGHGKEDEVLLEGVIGIAHGLGLTVCAEGVETAEQAGRLRGLGCDLAQGHYFSGPLTAEEASKLLSDP